jgi:hypothetical protein
MPRILRWQLKKKLHSSRYLPTIRASREASSPSKIRPVAEEPPELWVIQKVLVRRGDGEVVHAQMGPKMSCEAWLFAIRSVWM